MIVDCSTIQRELSGSELFGHVKGAYTGAVSDRDGAFNLAHEGTLFLDEIGELPLGLQAELLRVIQEGMYKAVGSNVWKSAAFRLICASNRDLRKEVEAGRFREDLFHRIAGQELCLPSLRERIGDISVLAHHFVRQLVPKEAPGFAPEFLHFLASQMFPGNVRELRQLILRTMQRYPGEGPITLGLLHPADRRRNQAAAADWRQLLERPVERAVDCGVALKDIGREAEELASRIALAMEGGNLPLRSPPSAIERSSTSASCRVAAKCRSIGDRGVRSRRRTFAPRPMAGREADWLGTSRFSSPCRRAAAVARSRYPGRDQAFISSPAPSDVFIPILG